MLIYRYIKFNLILKLCLDTKILMYNYLLVKLNASCQWIDYDAVYFSFSRLKDDRSGELPPEVLRQMRAQGLFDGRVRR
jgi:hypothetical protein